MSMGKGVNGALKIHTISSFSLPAPQGHPPLLPLPQPLTTPPATFDSKPMIYNYIKSYSVIFWVTFGWFLALKEYMQLSKKYYSTEPQAVDFLERAEETRKKINSWVKTQTKGKTKAIFPVLLFS